MIILPKRNSAFSAASGVTFTDDFNRANEPLETSSDWEDLASTSDSSLDIVSNELVSSTTANGQQMVFTYTGTLDDRQYAEIDITSLNGNPDNRCGVLLRATQGTGDEKRFYTFNYRDLSGEYQIVRYDEGGAASTSVLDNVSASAPTSGTRLRFEADGTSLVGKVDGVTTCTATDSTHTSGKAGVYVTTRDSGDSVSLDNFGCGDL